jgi:hypothetical protein
MSTGRKCPSLKIPRHIKCTTRAPILTAYTAPPHACTHWDTRKDPSELTCLLRSLLGIDIRTIEMATSTSPNHDSPKQSPENHIGLPYPSRRATRRTTPHPHTSRNHTTSQITASANLILPPNNRELAPQTLPHFNPRSTHPHTTRGDANQGHKAQQETAETKNNGASGGMSTHTTKAKEHHPLPHIATQWHSGNNNGHASGCPKIRAITNEILEGHHTHHCKLHAPNTQRHTHILTHQQHPIITLTRIEMTTRRQPHDGSNLTHSLLQNTPLPDTLGQYLFTPLSPTLPNIYRQPSATPIPSKLVTPRGPLRAHGPHALSPQIYPLEPQHHDTSVNNKAVSECSEGQHIECGNAPCTPTLASTLASPPTAYHTQPYITLTPNTLHTSKLTTPTP